MVLKLKTAPTTEPITRDEVKQHCRIDIDEDDIYIDSLITVARKTIEGLCGPLITQTWEQYESDWPDSAYLRIWKPRLQSPLTSIIYTDVNSLATTLSTSYYTIDTIDEYRPKVVLHYGYWWPITQLYVVNAIKITFLCGYGLAPAVPEPIKQAMLLLCSHLYENRELFNISISGNSVIPIPWTMEALLSSYRDWGYDV